MQNNARRVVDPFTAQLAARMAQEQVMTWEQNNRLPIIRLNILTALIAGGCYDTIEEASAKAKEIMAASGLVTFPQTETDDAKPAAPSLDGTA
jgi:hypothetical protein